MAASTQTTTTTTTTLPTPSSLHLTTPQPHNVHTTLHYLVPPPPNQAPPPTYVNRPETYARPSDDVEVLIHDIRGHEDEFTLDKNGFQIHRHVSGEKEFLDGEETKGDWVGEYYGEVERLLMDVTGASKIVIFDHTIRRNPEDSRTKANSPEGPPLRGPVHRVHIDQTPQASRNRVASHLPPEDVAKYLAGRHQIINVWRPIRTVMRDPLGIADARSVPDKDLVPVGLIYPNRKGETYGVLRGDDGAHKWYYKSYMSPEEVILIKCYDSKDDGRAKRVPHTAFVDPGADNEGPGRESIEVRALVLTPEDTE
ncbi:MAG: hypothetical protein M1834_008912 [Cirrosporium novae-zelandiae]|nr:MAG: hypothetical protein M1834_008912 [Cirrosporium novae-zelandiae]